MKLSVVTTVYQSEAHIDEFYLRVKTIADDIASGDYEIIFVNDGSPDDSLAVLLKLCEQDPAVVIVDLSRNFGHHQAIMAGLAEAKGDRIFLIDSDLEESPEWLIEFATVMTQRKCDVVYGAQRRRRGSVMSRFEGFVFYRLFRILTGIEQPNNIVTARLMTNRYVKSLLLFSERELNIGGIWMLAGYTQVQHYVEKRSSSPSTYTMQARLNTFVNAIVSFSNRPLEFTFYLGTGISTTATIYILYLLLAYFFLGQEPPTGYTSLIVSIWFFSGVIIFCIGLQGIYLSKIFAEVKRRPRAIVRRIYRY